MFTSLQQCRGCVRGACARWAKYKVTLAYAIFHGASWSLRGVRLLSSKAVGAELALIVLRVGISYSFVCCRKLARTITRTNDMP